MNIKELEQERDMFWHNFRTSDDFVSESDKEEGYPSKVDFLKQFYTTRKKIKASKSHEP